MSGDEKRMLLGFLQAQRDAVVEQVDGLSEELARRRLVPSLTTPIGVVNHLGGVERWWFRVKFAGQSDVPLPWTPEDLDADFKAEGITLVDAVAAYRAAGDESDAIAEAADLDDMSARPTRRGGDRVSLRWVLVHMIEETARHAGHLDILREQLDDGA